MAGSAAVLTDGSALSRADRFLERIERVLALLGGIAIFSLMVLAVVSVTGRNGLGQPLPGYVDWIEQAMPFIALLGISWCARDGGHIRMDIFVGLLRGRALWFFEIITTLLMLALVILLIWGAWAHFARSFDWNAPLWSRDSSIDIRLPLWPGKLAVPLALGVLALRLCLQTYGFSRAFWLGLERPVAVPLIESVAEQAAHEAAALDDAPLDDTKDAT